MTASNDLRRSGTRNFSESTLSMERAENGSRLKLCTYVRFGKKFAAKHNLPNPIFPPSTNESGRINSSKNFSTVRSKKQRAVPFRTWYFPPC
jgi:hypothetical protein